MAILQHDRPDQSHPSATLARAPAEGMLPLSQAINRLFQDSFLFPSAFGGPDGYAGIAGTNLWETGDGFVVQAAMPGMKPDSIAATVERDVLAITGEPALPAPQDARALWQSFGGRGEYRVQLPTEVESGRAEATYEAGVLTVRLPKAAHAQAHAIKVTAK